jgi:NADH-quinone oxidoreductase subunit N
MNIAINSADFQWIIPEIVVTVFGLLVLLVEAFTKGKGAGKAAGILTLIGTAVAFYYTACLWGVRADLFNSLYVVDNFATFFKLIFLVILFLVSILSLGYAGREGIRSGEYYGLLLFAVLGMMTMVSSNSFITIFIGLEVM